MVAAMKSLFLTHPRSVDESYAEHMAFAGRFSGKLFLADCWPGGGQKCGPIPGVDPSKLFGQIRREYPID